MEMELEVLQSNRYYRYIQIQLLAFATGGSPANGGVKSGFVSVTGAAGFNPINNCLRTDMTLTNTYVSGMADIVVGETSQGANTSSTLITKGTVVLK